MKRFALVPLLLAVALAAGGAVGCKKKAKSPTPIPARPVGVTGTTATPQPPVDTGGVDADTGIPPRDRVVPPGPGPGRIDDGTELTPLTTGLGNMNQDRERFRVNTVYFDFDRSTIKESQRSKIDVVVQHLRANPTHGVRIEGHCDERGTEGYNLALGERRALSVRDYLLNAGISVSLVDTISYGETLPAQEGHNEAAWSKNRRAEFILLTPRSQ